MTVYYVFLVLFCTIDSSAADTSENSTCFSVLHYGAVGDGVSDDTQAFQDAWNAMCSSDEESPAIIVPVNTTFLVHQVLFSGPCNAKHIKFLVLGKIVAPSSPISWLGLDPSRWIAFQHVEQLHVTGFGTIDGRGQGWWNQSCQYHSDLEECTSLAPTAHILISGCKYFNVDNLRIEAPGNSPNTDGIHIQASKKIAIKNLVIRTGDDCISIGDHTSNIEISSVICGPGHGVSIGSLGKSGNVVQVENIRVTKVYFEHTTNGARIKTWQVGTGYVRKVIFEDIRFHSVKNPIIIDQNYCYARGACEEKQAGVHISDVTYNSLYGTSSTDVAIVLNCSRSVACMRIVLKSVNLTSAKPGGHVMSSCTNAYGSVIGEVQPPPCLLGAALKHFPRGTKLLGS